MNKPVICTINTKSYLAHARTLAKTFLHHHPAGNVFMLLVDEIGDHYDPADEPFTTILAQDLNIPNFSTMSFRYTLFELSCALKPYLMEYLFNEYGCDKLCYFDVDITINHPLDEIFALLDSKLMVLVPHLLDFLEDGYHPDERSILQAGAYNAGFIGVAQHPELERFFHWWQRRLEKQSVVDTAQGLFADQRWMDLAPGLFADVHIHRDPGCNVAYWNLNSRDMEQTNTGYMVNGSVLKFFHFSGFSVENIEAISQHQNRYTLRKVPHLRPIYEQYRDYLVENGYHDVKDLPCAYNFFDNGVRIPDFARYLWRNMDEDEQRWSDPFNTHHDRSFISWLNEPGDTVGQNDILLTNLALEIYHRRVDLHEVFPDVLGRDRREFARWFTMYAYQEFKVDNFFIEPINNSLNKTSKTNSNHKTVSESPPDSPQSAKIYLRTRDFLNRIGVGPVVKGIIGAEQVWKVRQLFFFGKVSEYNRYRPTHVSPRPISEETEQIDKNDQQEDIQKSPGLNVVGYLSDEIGVGEVARSILKALDYKNFPVAQVTISNNEARSEDTSIQHLPAGNPYSINLFNVNADAVPGLYQYLGPDYFKDKYNIGFWFWELSEFPQAWRNSFSYLDEIWVGSNFVQTALASYSPIPVVNVRVPIIRPTAPTVTRVYLGLPEHKHIFLFAFDGLSFAERKNPLDLIEAYRTAFGPHFKDTTLVLKATKLDRNPKVAQRLRQEIDSVSGILIDRYMSRDELNGLFHACDTYVSLHRSEGFGLTIAEAMMLGKPVIATAYSANMDFMTPANSFPVSYRLVELEEDYGPYQKGNLWAAPDIAEAAALMKRVVDNPEEAQRKGLLAQEDIEQFYGIETVSKIIVKRLEAIQGWH